MSDPPLYPLIDPTNFDLIVIGTGLPQSIISAAASAAGKSVLHLDSNPFYGSHYTSLSFNELASFLQNSHLASPPSPPTGEDTAILNLTSRCIYADIEISNFAPELLAENSTKFNIDVSGPRVLYCADKSIDLLIKSGASHCMDFKSVDASFMGDASGELRSVPDSRAAIFRDKSLGLQEKNLLMRFFKRVEAHLAPSAVDEVEVEGISSRITEEDLESPFVSYLDKMRLPPKIKSIILYAISMADFDQEKNQDCKDMLKTKDGIECLALYHSSMGRFPNAPGAFLYPIYGQGELPQAFCRRAAVKGCLYVLRMPATALHMDMDNSCFKGVRLASGQDIYCQKLVLDPTYEIGLPSHSSPDERPQRILKGSSGKVARAICITGKSLKADTSNCMIIFPPRSLCAEQCTSVRALQIGPNLAVCPPGMFILYLSTLCDNANQGKESLRSAINTLLTVPAPRNPDSSLMVGSEISPTTELKPALVWCGLYVQELSKVQSDSVNYTAMPDGNLSYNNLLDETAKLFQKIYPGEEFFPESALPGKSVDDDDDDDQGSLDI